MWKENRNADALSQQPQLAAPTEGIAEEDFQVATVTSTRVIDLEETSIHNLLHIEPGTATTSTTDSFGVQEERPYTCANDPVSGEP